MAELIAVDTRAMKKFAKACRAADPALARRLRTRLRAAGQAVADQAKTNAAFSTRIPGSIKVSTAAGRVTITAGGKNAPNAAPIENEGKGHVRHPVFGDQDVWTDKNSPPAFLHPALAAKAEEARGAVASAILETLGELAAEGSG